VAGQRGFDGNLSRFLVADFADQNDVGIHPEVTPKCPLEREADLTVHLHLIDSSQRVLDGIFGGLDVEIRGVHFAQGRVERHRLA
jgi:hypothetical protein